MPSLRTRLPTLALALAAACGGEPAAPPDAGPSAEFPPQYSVGAIFGEAATDATASVRLLIAPLPPFPAELALTPAQQAAIRALHDAFTRANQADLDALAAATRELEAAHRAGDRARAQAVHERMLPIRKRLDTAFVKLRADVLAALTPAQRSWLDEQAARARACVPVPQPPTAEQRAQLEALLQAFNARHRADLDALAALEREALAARRAGRPAAEVQAILERGRPIRERLEAARRELQAQIDRILPPPPRPAGCPAPAPRPAGAA